jgi:hypothetical protein
MSRSFLYIFKDLTKLISSEYKIKVAGIGITCHLCYAISTKREKEIIVTKKYKYDANGFTNFMIVDVKGEHYNVNNSIWYMKWDSIEDWASIEVNDNINILYYGWRIPFIGIFPNIILLGKSNDKNKNTSLNRINEYKDLTKFYC